MSRFGGLPQTERIGRKLWRVTAPLVYESDLVGRVVVPVGFISDKASVPQMPLLYWLAGGAAENPGLVHDWLYDHAAVGPEPGARPVSRREADAVLAEAMAVEDDPEPTWRRWAMWVGVRIGGWWPWWKHRRAGRAGR